MRAGVQRRRGGRAALALLVGLVVGGWGGFGLTYLLKRHQFRDPDAVAEVGLDRADELKLVPADAPGFVHARLADLWRTEALAEFRKVVGKAGADALKALDDGFVPRPSSIDRATVVFLKGGGPGRPRPREFGFDPPGPLDLVGRDTPVVVLLAFADKVDPDAFRAANLPTAGKRSAGGKEYWLDERIDLGVHFATANTLVLGNGTALPAVLTAPAKADGPLAPALKLAAGGTRHVVAGMTASALDLPADLKRELPEVGPILKAEALSVGVVVGSGMRFDLRAAYKTDADADAAEKAVREAAKTGRAKLAEVKKRMEEAVKGRPGEPKPRPARDLPEAVGGVFALGAVNMLDEWLADLPLRRDGAELTASVTTPAAGGAYLGLSAASVGLLLPAVQKVREVAGRVQDSNNLKQIAVAMHNYEVTYGRLPAAALTNPPHDPKGKPLLSWRVAILPYVEGETLYRQFKLDEPWDSPHNKKLIPLMPKVYQSPEAPPGEPGTTYYKVFVGGGAMFEPRAGRSIFSVRDGSSNTFMVAEGGDPVIWTKPDDFAYDPKGPLPPLGLPGRPGFNVAMGDTSVRFVRAGVPERTLRLLIGANDETPVPDDW
ncbi:MAG: DUF1559 domain-containing protein [Gemmataceae bacterium]|nr:DUF1559 domain-containing protein [Gemmataceae bacterium]